jgi:hypothetical protein
MSLQNSLQFYYNNSSITMTKNTECRAVAMSLVSIHERTPETKFVRFSAMYIYTEFQDTALVF